MEKKNTSVFYNGLIWGLILGFAGIIFQVILYMIDQHLNQTIGYFGILISIVLMILGIRSFRDSVRDGILPFGPAFGWGIVVTAVSAVLGIVYSYILWTAIDPDIIPRMQEMQIDKLIERGLTEDAIDQVMPRMSKFMQPGIMAAMGLGTTMFFGTILSLIIAAIFKREE